MELGLVLQGLVALVKRPWRGCRWGCLSTENSSHNRVKRREQPGRYCHAARPPTPGPDPPGAGRSPACHAAEGVPGSGSGWSLRHLCLCTAACLRTEGPEALEK